MIGCFNWDQGRDYLVNFFQTIVYADQLERFFELERQQKTTALEDEEKDPACQVMLVDDIAAQSMLVSVAEKEKPVVEEEEKKESIEKECSGMQLPPEQAPEISPEAVMGESIPEDEESLISRWLRRTWYSFLLTVHLKHLQLLDPIVLKKSSTVHWVIPERGLEVTLFKRNWVWKNGSMVTVNQMQKA